MLAPLWVWLLLGETASAGTFFGGAILLAAILYNGFSGFRRLAQA
jgi:drug/metabolite transporter, DME family